MVSALRARRSPGGSLLLDESFRDVLPLLFEFLGVPDPERPAPRMDADARQRQLFGVLRRLVREAGAGEPTVTLIEDLHWIDGSSDAFLGSVGRGDRGHAGVCCVVNSPARVPRRVDGALVLPPDRARAAQRAGGATSCSTT